MILRRKLSFDFDQGRYRIYAEIWLDRYVVNRTRGKRDLKKGIAITVERKAYHWGEPQPDETSKRTIVLFPGDEFGVVFADWHIISDHSLRFVFKYGGITEDRVAPTVTSTSGP